MHNRFQSMYTILGRRQTFYELSTNIKECFTHNKYNVLHTLAAMFSATKQQCSPQISRNICSRFTETFAASYKQGFMFERSHVNCKLADSSQNCSKHDVFEGCHGFLS